MLSPQDLQQVADDLLELYRELEDELLASAAEKLMQLDLQDAAAAQELAAKLAAEAETRLGQMARQQQETLRSIFEKAADLALKQDAPVYARAGLAVPEQRSVALQQVIEETLQTTQATVSSLANSTPPGLQDAVLRAAEAARQQLEAGTVDAPTAQREAISMLAQEGLRVTHAASGRQERLEPALRRATLSGVNQAELAAQWQLAEELKTDLVETSAHIGARNKGDVPENHEMWQGRVFSRSGEHPHYPHFETITGYGTGAGLGGWNCRHSFAPFIEGVSRRRYSDEELARLAERKVSYRGEEMSVYEATQVQRRLERELRSWQRQANALQAAGLDNSAERAMMRQYQAELEKFLAETGLDKFLAETELDRISITGVTKAEFDRLVQKTLKPNTTLSKDELDQIVQHVAEADFSPEKNVRVKEKYAGCVVDGHTLEKGEITYNGYTHYAKHVLKETYWPEGTGYQQYIDDLKKVINDPNSGILWGKYQGEEQYIFWGKLNLRKENQSVVVIHRLGYDHWVTGFGTNKTIEEVLADYEDTKWIQF